MSFCKWNKLIDAKNEEQLLNALNASHKELHEVDRNEIANYAIQNFSFDSVGKQFKHAYEQALTE